jgi:hypothetical protein
MKELMVHVERAVRPVQACREHKDRMREELLAHLTELFEEERARLGDPAAALEEAIRRFGAAAELTPQLQGTVCRTERLEFLAERWLTWQAPESAAQYALRLAGQLFLLSMMLSAIVVLVVVLTEGWAPDLWMRLRVGVSFLIVLHTDLFLLALLYARLREAMWGGLAVKRSWLRAAVLMLLLALAVPASGVAYGVIALGSWTLSLELLYLWYPFAILIPLAFSLWAWFRGPAEIRHAEWACLDIGE